MIDDDLDETLWALGTLMEARGMQRVEIPREMIQKFRKQKRVVVSYDPKGATVLELRDVVEPTIIRPDPVELRR